MPTTDRKVVEKRSLVEFIALQRQENPAAKLKVAHFTDGEGVPFTSLAVTCTDDKGLDTTLCLIGFSEKTGELSAKQVAEKKADLLVLRFSDGKLKLVPNEDTWEEVDI